MTAASRRLGLAAMGRFMKEPAEDDATQHADEAQGVQELARAYAGLVITRAALRRIRGSDTATARTAGRRKRKSVEDYLATHI